MKTLLHNFITIFRRHKMAAGLNIVGLTVAFTTFIILMMQVSYDYGYDRFHTNSDRIFRVEMEFRDGGGQAVFPRPLIESFFASSPHIQESSIACRWNVLENVAVEYNGERFGFNETYYMVGAGYPKVFGFEIIAGDPNVLDHPDKVLISESMARRFFPDGVAVGRRIDGDELKAEVGAIYKDFPENSLIKNAIYQRLPDDHGAGEWRYHNYEGFVLLDNAANKELVLENFETNVRPSEYTLVDNKIRMTNIPDVYYTTDIHFDSHTTKGSRAQVFVLSCIAFLILLIAAVNFTNFSNALVPLRLKTVNTQKVLGCSIKTLRTSMIMEAIILCIVSFLLALWLIFLLSGTGFSDIVSGGILLSRHIPVIAGAGLIAFLTGVLAGSWPAWYITSFNPALVLKGNFGLSPKGRKLRSLLVGMQFVSTFVLIVVAIFVTLQNRYMTNSSLGFEKDRIAIIKLNRNLGNQPELIRQQLVSLAEIEEVSLVDRIIGGGDTYSTFGRTYNGEGVEFELVRTDPHIFNVLGISVTNGRPFVDDDYAGDGCYIFNEKARLTWDLEVGNAMNLDWQDFHRRERIVGIMDDMKYNSFRNELKPFAFYAQPGGGFKGFAMIRIHDQGNYAVVMKSVNELLTGIDPDYPLEISLYSQVMENLYQKELLLGNQIFLFSIVAIFISLIGVFGIVLFESQYKRREISIRKVFGSTIREVVLLLSNQYIRILTICFILASPIAWYAVSNWLQNFVYKTPIYLWVFAFAFIGVSFLTLVTISIQNWRVARTNPIDSLRAE